MKSGTGMLRVLRSGLIAAFAAAALFAPSVMATWPASPASGERACESSFCGKCGDGYCNKRCGETAQTCPKDCGLVSE